MESLQRTNFTKRILSLTFVLILISAFVVIFMGTSSANLNKEIKQLNAFVGSARNLQSNFEQSLQMYTESTQEIISYLSSLRPDSEEDFINFISAIETIEQRLGFSLNLKSLNHVSETLSVESPEKTLDYSISFYGNLKDLNEILTELQQLPYYIRIDQINFVDLEFLTKKEEKQDGNISLVIKLYIKSP